MASRTVWSRSASMRLHPIYVHTPPLPRLRCRATFMSSQISNIPSVQAKFSKGEDEDKMRAELAALLENGWKLDPKQAGLEKTFYLKTYTKVLEFGSLTVLWTTHHPRGISEKDTVMAKFCDESADLVGTVERSAAQKCGPSKPSQI